MDGTMRLPMARSEGLVIEELDDELLVYDLDVDRAHCLGATAGRVWQACDGTTDAATIADRLDLLAEEVTRAFDELDGCGLLQAPVLDRSAMTRRDLSFKVIMGGAAVATAPLILSIAAPAAAQTASQIKFCTELQGGGSQTACSKCNVGGTGQNPCCCCRHTPLGDKFCAPGATYCTSVLMGTFCTENDPN